MRFLFMLDNEENNEVENQLSEEQEDSSVASIDSEKDEDVIDEDETQNDEVEEDEEEKDEDDEVEQIDKSVYSLAINLKRADISRIIYSVLVWSLYLTIMIGSIVTVALEGSKNIFEYVINNIPISEIQDTLINIGLWINIIIFAIIFFWTIIPFIKSLLHPLSNFTITSKKTKLNIFNNRKKVVSSLSTLCIFSLISLFLFYIILAIAGCGYLDLEHIFNFNEVLTYYNFDPTFYLFAMLAFLFLFIYGLFIKSRAKTIYSELKTNQDDKKGVKQNLSELDEHFEALRKLSLKDERYKYAHIYYYVTGVLGYLGIIAAIIISLVLPFTYIGSTGSTNNNSSNGSSQGSSTVTPINDGYRLLSFNTTDPAIHYIMGEPSVVEYQDNLIFYIYYDYGKDQELFDRYLYDSSLLSQSELEYIENVGGEQTLIYVQNGYLAGLLHLDNQPLSMSSFNLGSFKNISLVDLFNRLKSPDYIIERAFIMYPDFDSYSNQEKEVILTEIFKSFIKPYDDKIGIAVEYTEAYFLSNLVLSNDYEVKFFFESIDNFSLTLDFGVYQLVIS